MTKIRRKGVAIVIIIILVVVYILMNYQDNWKKENCELTFNTYTYNNGCASACSSKCFNEGFPYTDAGFFEPYLSVEEMANTELYKRCECNCGGCRER
ncbi:MAG TPA: hypothetical protein ENG87_02270 [Candidatus Pacearchaeota archaeon]|nr:hypothetical protein BMS3Abin17_00370 [archaeon BMS3Abin17]HDK42180.1 hypothetical protein [Candidatus Pacearchaeota archaeon]HDZ60237.1 hypothetical protein [Candidatus Pacearchaeota archaeon]